MGLEWISAHELTDPMAVEPFRLRSRLPSDAASDEVNVHFLSRGKSPIRRPLQFDVAQGIRASDFLWTQLINPVCISERVVCILRNNEVSGWATYPVEVFDKEGNLLSEYHGLAVTGAVCEADFSRSTVVTKPPPTPRGKSYKVYRGLHFNEEDWDGSDMFWVGGVRVVVERVKELLEQEMVENVRFTPLPDWEVRVRYVRSA